MKFRVVLLSLALVAACVVSASAGTFSGGINAGLGMPIGDLSDFASTGFTIGVQGEQRMNDHIAVGGEIGLQSYGGNDDLEKNLSVPGNTADFTLTAIPVIAYGKFMLAAQGTALPYLRAGLGLYHLTGKVEGGPDPGDESKTKFGLSFGGGSMFKATDSLSWGVDGLYHYVLGAANDSSGDETAGSIITVRGLLMFGTTK